MIAVDRFRAEVEPMPDDQPQRLQLLLDGEPWGEKLVGSVMAGQFLLGEQRVLLLVTDDCPYEETLRIYLLDSDGQTLDGLELGAAFATGTLERVEITGERSIAFDFVHRARCHLTVGEQPTWRWTLLAKPGVNAIGPTPMRGWLQLRFDRSGPN